MFLASSELFSSLLCVVFPVYFKYYSLHSLKTHTCCQPSLKKPSFFKDLCQAEGL